MSEFKNERFEQSLEQVQQNLVEQSKEKDAPMLLAGHGTNVSDPSLFFDGLGTGYDSIHATAVVLTPGDSNLRDTLSTWRHRDASSVVLIAASHPGSNSTLDEKQRMFWDDGLIQPADENKEWPEGQGFKYEIPGEWILGVFKRNTGKVTMNPNFTGREVTPEDMETCEGARYRSAADVGALTLQDVFGVGEHQVAEDEPVVSQAADEIDDDSAVF